MRKILLSSALTIICFLTEAQVPQGINYQAVLYNNAGSPVAGTSIQVKAGILSDTLTPVIVWEELHSSVKTNSSGVFNLVIGTGTKESGSAATFSAIDWTVSPLFLRVQVNYQGTWKTMGSSRLWTVPYAMTADELTGSLKKLAVTGETTNAEEALFEVKNKDGQTVFAVYNEGVRIYVDDGAKGPKGGFAVGGFGTSKAASQNLLYVDTDSIRAYVSNETAKGVKGGFAVGGFGTSKAQSQNYLYIDPDSIRAYVNTAPVKGAKGGFAVGGFGTTKGDIQDLLFVGADSIRAYIDTSTGKGPKGGFAVGGFGTSKGETEEYLRVTRDSTRVYINNETPAVKGAKGGFAVGGFGTTKGDPENFMFIDPDSTRFYIREFGPGSSSTFNIVGINLDQTQTLLMTANTDTVGIGGVLDVQNNLNVTGDIGYTGTVTSLVPTVYTMEPFDITDSSAVVMGDISDNGGAAVIVSGVVWSTSPTPTVDLVTKTTDGTSTGQYSSQITGLTAATTYYARAYATNSNGTGYGQDVVFTTAEIIADFDGNQYYTVTIGTQVWLAENLKTTHYNDGTAIPNVTDESAWMVLSTPGYAWYNNDASTYSDYGILYNWHAVNTGILCPTGWHVPSDAEWTTLMTYAGGGYFAGGKLKEAGLTHWLSPNTDATNEYGFTALPGGMRAYMGPFFDLGSAGNWWTSTMISVDAAYVKMFSATGEMMVMQMMSGAGMSVRCLKDDIVIP